MEIFINELSLHSQFACIEDFNDAIIELNRILLRLSNTSFKKQVFFDPSVYTRDTIGNRIFSSCLERMPDPDARTLFKRLLREKLTCTDWQKCKEQEECEYEWIGRSVAETSLAELGERILRGRCGLLVNFSPSEFLDHASIEIERDHSRNVTLDQVNIERELESYFSEHLDLGAHEYDPHCGRKPLDQETILRDKDLFEKTKYRNHSRIVYRHRKNGLLFCVDNFHKFGFHLEVFDPQGAHVGEADLNGTIDHSKLSDTKHLDVS